MNNLEHLINNLEQMSKILEHVLIFLRGCLNNNVERMSHKLEHISKNLEQTS